MILKLQTPLHAQRASALYDEQAQRLHQERLLIRGAMERAPELSAAAFFGPREEGGKE
jgi:hypothetical protein